MWFKKVLIANRGEIAVRIARAAGELGLETVAVFPADDSASLHARAADEARELPGAGAAAYLDIDVLVAAARETGCQAIHPGYGFLSESAELARRAAAQGLTFVGPSPDCLDLFGDKARARAFAIACDVPVVAGTQGAATLAEAQAFLASLGPGAAVMVKAISGGGGRGMRVARTPDELSDAYERCASEARASFGSDALYVERFMDGVRHIEVQIVGDGHAVAHLGERECTIQRRRQKIVEIAPSPGLPGALRSALCEAAVRMARAANYSGLGTFEFLVPAAPDADSFVFIEANPRIQVEHTITEEVTGFDLVKTQFRLAGGARLGDLGLGAGHGPAPRGSAIQLRVNMESIDAHGATRPSGGTLRAFDIPSGPGVRIDTFGYAGYATNPRYDSLLAKIVVHAPEGHRAALARARRALREFRIEGLATNIPLLQSLLDNADFVADRISTDFLEDNMGALAAAMVEAGADKAHKQERGRAAHDPLGVFDAGAAIRLDGGAKSARAKKDGSETVLAPLQGTIVSVDVAPGDFVRAGQHVAIVESMKMEHLVAAPVSGLVEEILVEKGETVFEADALMFLAPSGEAGGGAHAVAELDLDHIRADLAESLARHAELMDAARPDAVARRRKTGQRTTRENIADLCDPDTFIEYGGLALAAQRQRRSAQELKQMSPADGMIAGLGAVNGALFPDERSRCAVLAYDYTVFAGTQGVVNHKKKDRLLHLAEKWSLPVVVFAEGGGGRPGDEWPTPAGLDTTTFLRFGELNAQTPTIGMTSGRCFAGNAALLGMCDVIIAAKGSNIGMGGPAMIEGGGLGVFRPEDVGPMEVQVPNGVVDIAVEDEAEGVAVAKKYLSYFQGALAQWSCADQRLLRFAVPENRMRAYDVRAVIETLADEHSVLELRPEFGLGMITAFIRLEGRPVGLIANNSRHLGGAIDADGADKAARFVQLCDAFDLPIVSLCDTPGMMVGPEVEKTAQVRHVSRMFVAAARATVPIFTIVLRKGYGLGALAMAGGSSQGSFFIVGWPSAEFGAMGLEGAVKLAYRKELLAIEDAGRRKEWFEAMVAKSYEENKALSAATFLEVDDVIDPRDTRHWLMRGLRSLPPRRAPGERKTTRADVW